MSQMADSSGSLIVEALVAITLLGVVGASSHLLHGAAQDARARSLERMVATWEMRSEIETSDGRARPAWVANAGPIEVTIDRIDGDVTNASDPARCAALGVESERSMLLVAQSATRGATVASIEAPRRLREAGATDVRADPSARAALTVQVDDSGGWPLVGVPVLVVAHGDTAAVDAGSGVQSTGPEGCTLLQNLGGGPHDLVILLPDHLDRLHRPVDGRFVVALIPGVPTRHRLAIAAAASLTVRIEAAGSSRLPDDVEAGALDWTIAGDGVARPDPDATTLLVHPGRQDVLVGVCKGSLGVGTWSTVTLDAGMHHDVIVSLPSLLLPALDVPSDGARVLARRDTDCPGSSGTRPILRWDIPAGSGAPGGHAPDIALPHGPWMVEVRSSGGVQLFGPTRVQVTGDGQAA